MKATKSMRYSHIPCPLAKKKARYIYPDVKDEATYKLIDILEPFSGYYKKSEDYVLCFVERLFEKRNLGSLLDLGCGDARLTVKFSKYFTDIVALDPDRERLQKARHNIKSSGVEGVKFLQTLFLDARLPEDYFDAVICSHVLQHISTGNLADFINKIYKILKVSGFLVLLTTHSRKNHDVYVKSFIKKDKLFQSAISKREFNSLIFNDKGILPACIFSLRNLKNALKRFNLLEIKVYHEPYPFNMLDRFLFRDKLINLSFLKKFFGADIMIIASKGKIS